jgi:hypothetical protein
VNARAWSHRQRPSGSPRRRQRGPLATPRAGPGRPPIRPAGLRWAGPRRAQTPWLRPCATALRSSSGRARPRDRRRRPGGRGRARSRPSISPAG